MGVVNGADQSSLYLTGVVIFVLLLAVVPVCATSASAPDTSQGMTDRIGLPGPKLTADTLTISANKDSVVLGGRRFSVTIVGSPQTFYYLWVKNTSAMTGAAAMAKTSMVVFTASWVSDAVVGRRFGHQAPKTSSAAVPTTTTTTTPTTILPAGERSRSRTGGRGTSTGSSSVSGVTTGASSA